MKKNHSNARIVIVSEEVELNNELDIFSGELEATTKKTLQNLLNVLENLGFECIHYPHPVYLARNIDSHRNDLVLSAWNGEASLSRVSIIPAICESANISYIGADAATRAICNDKELSKSIARKLGFKVSCGLRLLTNKDLDTIEVLKLPVIVKPCNEGSSIGIDENSVCHNYQDIIERTRLLWDKGFAHVYAEEFIYGREMCICLMGNNQILYAKSIEVTLSRDPYYLLNNPYSAEMKKGFLGEREINVLDDDLLIDELSYAKTAFNYFGKINLFRVDGRLNDQGEFIFIEFATQPTLGLGSETWGALSTFFPDFSSFIKALINLEIVQYQDQDTNSLE